MAFESQLAPDAGHLLGFLASSLRNWTPLLTAPTAGYSNTLSEVVERAVIVVFLLAMVLLIAWWWDRGGGIVLAGDHTGDDVAVEKAKEAAKEKAEDKAEDKAKEWVLKNVVSEAIKETVEFLTSLGVQGPGKFVTGILTGLYYGGTISNAFDGVWGKIQYRTQGAGFQPIDPGDAKLWGSTAVANDDFWIGFVVSKVLRSKAKALKAQAKTTGDPKGTLGSQAAALEQAADGAEEKAVEKADKKNPGKNVKEKVKELKQKEGEKAEGETKSEP